MVLELSPAEVELLLGVLEASERDLLRQIHHADSREYRERLEREAASVRKIRARLKEGARTSGLEQIVDDSVIDESVEESFPASDPPARSRA